MASFHMARDLDSTLQEASNRSLIDFCEAHIQFDCYESLCAKNMLVKQDVHTTTPVDSRGKAVP